MQVRDSVFYDIVSKGLAGLGFVDKNGVSALSQYLDFFFAEKYNIDGLGSKLGFSVNPNTPIKPMWEQIEATRRPYTMASYVDIDSDGPTKSTDGLTLSTGEIPTFKHEFSLNRKVLREQMQLTQSIGHATPEIVDTVMELFFTALDDLLGGNYNTLEYQRHQIVSNQCKLVLTDTNNPLGYAHTFKFDLDEFNNVHDVKMFKKSATGNVTEDEDIAATVPFKKIKAIVRKMKEQDFSGPVDAEISYNTLQDIINLPYVQDQYVRLKNPLVTDSTTIASLVSAVEDEAIIEFVRKQLGVEKLHVIDFLGASEYFDKESGAMKYHYHPGFKEGVIVLRPAGDIGDIQFGKPLWMETPGSRAALYDGGRTLIRNIFNDENMVQTVKSEVTGFVIPNKVRHMHYVNVGDINSAVADGVVKKQNRTK